jgi:hypothetical protein
MLSFVLGVGTGVPAAAWAGGAPALQVKEMSAKKVDSPVEYLNALNLRGPMLATCYGSKDVLARATPIEAFLDVAKDGAPSSVNVSLAGADATPELEACLLSQLSKARFPPADRSVEIKVILGPAPPPRAD